MLPDTLLTDAFRLTAGQKAALKKLKLATVRDLLSHFPVRYTEPTEQKYIGQIATGEKVTLYGRISKLESKKGWHSKIPMTTATFEDATGSLRLVWFHQPYIAKMIPEGAMVRIAGKVATDKHGLSIANPEIERAGAEQDLPTIFAGTATTSDNDAVVMPIYPETRGLTSRWIYHALKKAFTARVHEAHEDPIPAAILERYHLPSRATALLWIHAPRNEKDAQAARKRFAFEEVFLIQLDRIRARRARADDPTFIIRPQEETVRAFVDRFPFTLTSAQDAAIATILEDFARGAPMARLLEGDVGSGKTAVAAATAHAVVTSRPDGRSFGNLQTAIMAPTEILARQHFESFIGYFAHLPIKVGLITSKKCRIFPSKVNPHTHTNISRAQLLKWVENGEVPILIGTHALIQKAVRFKHLAYVIIDEQHRFGTRQRGELIKKHEAAELAPRAHLLSMTATPIPRTLALTIYGDLDLTLIDTMPAGRKPIVTEMVSGDARATAYERARGELAAGRQVYIICPRIDEPDPEKETALQAKSVTEEAVRLKKEVFPDYAIEILHSKMKPTEKEAVMERFASCETHILVATSVVEVGVNVQNATTIIIEGAERFGLAQLHQLRGRVLRSTHQAYCFLVCEGKSKLTKDRIKTLVTAKNGFELAERDLLLRGAGELKGGKQWGISDIGMEAIKNIKMVEAARHEAAAMLDRDPDLARHPHLAIILASYAEDMHFE